ncbi:MAG: DUF3089 domain-containing protein [Saprospiraceae bacterium]|nr:DUF3089 domain-containing protein [Saprospiraceae bacterium]
MTRTVFQYFTIACICIGIASCASLPKGTFGNNIPDTPDYSNLKNWAALPTQRDSADAVPVAEWKDVQADAVVDVFYIHPTTYTGKHGENEWNASLDDTKLNLETDQYPIRYQASVFNGAGKIYAPRYRQAHLNCFFTDKKSDAGKALDLAYQDVRSAFSYYLQHFNNGRPFIIASHSQGTYHAKRLMREFVDGKPLQNQFVVGYLAGLTVPSDYFKTIHPCTNPEETGCFCTWRTFRNGYVPKKLHFPDSNIVVTNPVTWSQNQPECTQEFQLGGVLKDFKKVYPGLVETCVHEDLLWVNKPKFPGSFLLTTKNYHIADYNFFYADIRHNAQVRVNAFLGKG